MTKQNFIIPNERPAFMQIIDYNQSDYKINDGYILQIDNEHLSASIINLKKGGKNIMVKTVEKVKEGYEQIYNDVIEYEQHLEEKIRQQMAEDLERVKVLKAQCVETVEVEVPDEEETTEEVTVEENV